MSAQRVFDNRKRVTYATDMREVLGQTVGPSTLGELWAVDAVEYDEAGGTSVVVFRPARGTDPIPADYQRQAHAAVFREWARGVADRIGGAR